MCPLAEVLRGMGLVVHGSDIRESDAVKHLKSLGIHVDIGHSAENLGDCDFIIRTAAVHDDNPEISGAVTRGIPVYERAQALGAIMRHYPNALCISGTHGKTTTTSMGTALTQEQTRLLSRYTKELVLCYDNDNAGKIATERALQILNNSEFAVRVLQLPNKKLEDGTMT